MPTYEGYVSSQDGLGLIELLKNIYFEQDRSKQWLADIVDADKRLMLCWQQPGMTIDEYTREFKARVQMCEELDSNIGHNVELQKLVCKEQSLTYTTVILNTTNSGKERWRKIKQTARDQYLAMLHFDGLNQNAYGDLQLEI